MADKKQKREMSAEQKKAYTVSTPDATVVVSCRAAPQQLKSVYTGRAKATVENHLKHQTALLVIIMSFALFHRTNRCLGSVRMCGAELSK